MYLGVDLGGTKTEVLVLSETGEHLFSGRKPTPSAGYEAMLTHLVSFILEAEKEVGYKCYVGLGIPGALSGRNGRVKNANSTCLIGEDLQGDLETRLERAIKLENDANCMAWSEAVDGAAADVDTLFAVILGTGAGGGLVVNGRLIRGHHRIAGEWGHNPLPGKGPQDEPGIPCYCGHQGCIETYLSGPGWMRWSNQKTGRHLTSEQWIAAMRQGDVDADVMFDLYCDRAARSIASVINIIDPQRIVVAGGLSNVSEIYPRIEAYLPKYVFNDEVTIRVVPAKHGDASGVRGAAWLWKEAF
jgi:fructokinase